LLKFKIINWLEFVMKRLLYSTVAAISLISGTYLSAVYYAPSDPIQKRAELSLVDSIKKESNLTHYDVDKWKAWFLGMTGIEGAAIVSAYGAALVGDVVGNIVWRGVGGNIVPEKYRSLVSFGASIAPAVGTWKLVFPVLASRTEVGVVSRIGRLQELCNSLSIATVKERDLDKLKQYIDSSWKNKGEIAWCLAIDNLIEQCGYAIDLCGQLASWGRYSSWANTFYDFASNLKHNRALLAPLYDAEMARRAGEQGK
jgi:hypothetical protein